MTSLGDAALDALTSAGLDPVEVERIVLAALHEDLVLGPDLTTEATVPAGATATADVVAREAGTVAGVAVALAVLDAGGFPLRSSHVLRHDGEGVSPGDAVLRLT